MTLVIIMSVKGQVKVTYSPIEEVVIVEHTQYPLDLFIELEGIPARAGQFVTPLNWVEGVIFRHLSFPSEESVLEELRKGRVYWVHVAFALMPEFKPQVSTKDGRVTISVLNRSDNPAMSAATKWLREHATKM